MATISPDQLPSPISAFAPPTPGVPVAFHRQSAPSFAPASIAATTGSRPPRRNRSAFGLAAAGLAIVAGVAFAATRDGDEEGGRPTIDAAQGDGDTSTTVDSSADEAFTDAELGMAYAAILGMQPAADTTVCLADEVVDVEADLRRFLDGELLDFVTAQATFTPFLRCAPDEDFLRDMVTVAQQQVPGSDAACIEQLLLTLGTTARAEAIALAYADRLAFRGRLKATVAGCA